MLKLVRFSALHQIKSYDPQLWKPAVNSLDFRLCNITCQVVGLRVNLRYTLRADPTHIGQGVDYWGFESHLRPTLSHFRVNIKWFNAVALADPFRFNKFHLYTKNTLNP